MNLALKALQEVMLMENYIERHDAFRSWVKNYVEQVSVRTEIVDSELESLYFDDRERILMEMSWKIKEFLCKNRMEVKENKGEFSTTLTARVLLLKDR